MPRSKRTGKTYPLNQSPLYGVKSKRRLYEVLLTDKQKVSWLLDHSQENYNQFSIGAPPKTRDIEEPKPKLKEVHLRIHFLLSRIETPAYLHSGKSDKSYVTNALLHRNSAHVAKTDIKKFFPSTKEKHIRAFFSETLCCAPDVSHILVRLCLIDGHIPTGSHLSQILAFWAYKRMFDQIDEYAKSKNLLWSCYVDDITISGPTLPKGCLAEVSRIASKFGLVCHKSKIFRPGIPRLVTGVVLSGGVGKVEHRKIVSLRHAYVGFRAKRKQGLDASHDYQKLVGRLYAAGQVEPKYRALGKRIVSMRRSKLI